jgi:tetratricopeptide (TPR) repeat protein
MLDDQPATMSLLLSNLGTDLHGQGKIKTATTMLRRALTMEPDNTNRMVSLAGVLILNGQLDEGESLLDRAAMRSVNDPFAWNVKGFLHAYRKNTSASIEAFRRAVEVAPNNGMMQFDLACHLLAAGQYREGFDLYEVRKKMMPYRRDDRPEWQGQSGAHLYVWAEQGIGDTIAFARFLTCVAPSCERITFSVTAAIHSLMIGYERIPNVKVVPHEYDVKDADYQISLMSIPRLIGMSGEVPADPGLLNVATVLDGGLRGPVKKVGICWAGNPKQVNDPQRSMPFATMLRLAESANVELYSLQVGARSADIGEAQAQRLVHDLSGSMQGDWAGSAAVIKQLDAVVSVCTGPAHLAAALGVPAHVCLNVAPYWIWGQHDSRTAWYPSARLHRQKRLGDWDQVIDDVKEALA